MKASTYTSSYLTADDVKKPMLLVIGGVYEETIGNDAKPKLVLYSEDEETKIALNKSNINKLIEIFGDDETDNWIGLQVEVYRDPSIMFQNKRVGGIAFRKPKNGIHPAESGDTSFDSKSL